MSGARKRQGLRWDEILAAQQLVMECAELWYDPSAWRARLLEGLRELTPATIVGCEHYEIRPDAPDGSTVASTSQGDWPSARARDEFHAWQEQTPAHQAHPPEMTRFVWEGLLNEGGRTFLRQQAMDDAAWQRSQFFQECFDPAGLSHVAASFRAQPHVGQLMVLNLNMVKGEPQIAPWQRDLLGLIHDLLAPLVGRRLAVEGQRSVDGLSPRRRQVLDVLLRGLSEKEAAAALGIAYDTVHQYVGELYRHFGVHSRAELMAYFIRRRPDDAEG